MFYVILAVGIVALIVLYKFLANKKIFLYFCATLMIVFCISAFIQSQSRKEEFVSRAQIENIRLQQKIFSDWYTEYQKDIDHLDRNWQLLHSITENLKTEEIYEYSTYEQLLELEEDALDEQAKIHALRIPAVLDFEYAALLSEIIRKTNLYVDSQTKTISAVRKAANPETFKDLKTLNKTIKEILIRESPTGLFMATEIAAIRERLTVPGEGVE